VLLLHREVLTSEITKKIEDFVYAKPRSIQEVAQFLKKNWRTADRYITQIEKEFGTLATRTFRGGTRGSLKVVYWASIEKISKTIFQQQLEHDIFLAKRKEDFSAFDMYQHVPDKDKQVSIETAKNEEATNLKEFTDMLSEAKQQILMFSGNLSFTNLKNEKSIVFDTLDKLVKKGVIIKVLSRVDIAGKQNTANFLSLNFKHAKERIEVRHREQPLRAVIIDNKICRIKEIKEPTGKINELNTRVFMYYTIKNKEWVEWLSHVFWKMFNNSIDAQKRLEELNKLKE